MQTASLILGVLALSLIFVPILNVFLSPMLGVAALVMGLISGSAARRAGQDSHRATAGATTGAIALVLGLLLVAGIYVTVSRLITSFTEDAAIESQVDERFGKLSDDLRKDLDERIELQVKEGLERERLDRQEKWKRDHPDIPPDPLGRQFEDRMDEWMEWLEQMPLRPAEPFGPGGPHEGMDAPIAPAPIAPAPIAPVPTPP